MPTSTPETAAAMMRIDGRVFSAYTVDDGGSKRRHRTLATAGLTAEDVATMRVVAFDEETFLFDGTASPRLAVASLRTDGSFSLDCPRPASTRGTVRLKLWFGESYVDSSTLVTPWAEDRRNVAVLWHDDVATAPTTSDKRFITGRLVRWDGTTVDGTAPIELSVRVGIPRASGVTAVTGGTASVNAEGAFSMEIALTEGALPTTRLVLQVLNEEDEVVAETRVVQGIGEAYHGVARVRVAGLGGESEFAWLERPVASAGAGLKDLVEGDAVEEWTHANIMRASNALDVAPGNVAAYVRAYRGAEWLVEEREHFGDTESVLPGAMEEEAREALYGLFRAGLPTSVGSAARQTVSEAVRRLTTAANRHAIGATWADEEATTTWVETFLAAFNDYRAKGYRILLDRMLPTGVSAAPDIIVRAVGSERTGTDAAWDLLRNALIEDAWDEEDADAQIAAARFAARLWHGLEGHVETLHALVPSAVGWTAARASLLVRTVKTVWETLDAAEVDPPSDYDDLRAWSRQVIRAMETSFPEDVFQAQAAASGSPESADVKTVLGRMVTAGVPLLTGNLALALADDESDLWDGLTSGERTAARDRVLTLRRLGAVIPPWQRYFALSALETLSPAPGSAAAIVRRSRASFVVEAAAALRVRWQADHVFGGSGTSVDLPAAVEMSEAVAGQIYDAAASQRSRSQMLQLSRRATQGPDAPPYIAPVPDVLPSAPLPSACAVSHCESVFGPGSYLYSLLDFLGGADGGLGEPGVSLLSFLEEDANLGTSDAFNHRRADLLDLELDCANADTPIPNIDLVNELLEHRVVATALEVDPDLEHNSVPVVVQALPTTTSGTPEERRMEPEHTQNRVDAEWIVSGALYPRPLPIDLPEVEARLLLERENLARRDLMEAQQSVATSPAPSSPGPVDIARAGLGLNAAEVALLLAESSDLPSVAQWFGEDSSDADWRSRVSQLPAFMAATGLSFEEVIDLLSCRSVNPRCLTNIEGRDGCDLSSMRLSRSASVSIAPSFADGVLTVQLGGDDTSYVFGDSGFEAVDEELTTSATSPSSWTIAISTAGAFSLVAFTGDAASTVAVVNIVGGVAELDDAPRPEFFARAVRVLIVRKALGGSLLDADRAIRSVLGSDKVAAWTWTGPDLVALDNVRQIQARIGGRGSEVLATLVGSDTFDRWDLETSFAPSPFDKRFQSVAIASPVAGALVVSAGRGALAGGTPLTDPQVNAALLGGARLRASAWASLVALDPEHPFALPNTNTTLSNVWAVERASAMARAMGRGFEDAIASRVLLGTPSAADDAGRWLEVVRAAESLAAVGVTSSLARFLVDHVARATDDDRGETFVAALDSIHADVIALRSALASSAASGAFDSYPDPADTDFMPVGSPESADKILSPLFSGDASGVVHPSATAVRFAVIDLGATTPQITAAVALLEAAQEQWPWLTIPDGESTWAAWVAAARAESTEIARQTRLRRVGAQWWQWAQLAAIVRSAPANDGELVGAAPPRWSGALVDEWVRLVGVELPEELPISDSALFVRLVFSLLALPHLRTPSGALPNETDANAGWTANLVALRDEVAERFDNSSGESLVSKLLTTVAATNPWLSTATEDASLSGGWLGPWRDELWITVPPERRLAVLQAIALAHATRRVVGERVSSALSAPAGWVDAALTAWLPASHEGVAYGDEDDTFYGKAIVDFTHPGTFPDPGPEGEPVSQFADEEAAAWAWQHLDRIRKTLALESAVGLGLGVWSALEAWTSAVQAGAPVANRQTWPFTAGWPAGVTVVDTPDPAVTVADLIRIARLAGIERRMAKAGDDSPTAATVAHALALQGTTPGSELLASLGLAETDTPAALLASRLGVDAAAVAEVLGEDGLDAEGLTLWRLAEALQSAERLHSVHQASATLGLGFDELLYLRAPAVDAEMVTQVRRDLRQLYGDESWTRAYVPISDRMRETRRDAYLAWITTRHPVAEGAPRWTSADLHAHLLTDPLVGASMLTSRLVAAHTAVQVYVQRIQLGLEPRNAGSEWVPAKLTAKERDTWAWMGRYRLWEANMRVLVYPENWIDPALLHEKTPLFKAFESQLRRPRIELEDVDQAVGAYVDGLMGCGQLEIASLARYDKEDDSGEYETMHLLGRSRATPRRWYYRSGRRDGTNVGWRWAPWEAVEADIQDTTTFIVEFGGRLLLGWIGYPEGRVHKTRRDGMGSTDDEWKRYYQQPPFPETYPIHTLDERMEQFALDVQTAIADAKAQAEAEKRRGDFPVSLHFSVRGASGFDRAAQSVVLGRSPFSLPNGLIVNASELRIDGDARSINFSFFSHIDETPWKVWFNAQLVLDSMSVMESTVSLPIPFGPGPTTRVDSMYTVNDTYDTGLSLSLSSSSVEVLTFDGDSSEKLSSKSIAQEHMDAGFTGSNHLSFQDDRRTFIIERFPPSDVVRIGGTMVSRTLRGGV